MKRRGTRGKRCRQKRCVLLLVSPAAIHTLRSGRRIAHNTRRKRRQKSQSGSHRYDGVRWRQHLSLCRWRGGRAFLGGRGRPTGRPRWRRSNPPHKEAIERSGSGRVSRPTQPTRPRPKAAAGSALASGEARSRMVDEELTV